MTTYEYIQYITQEFQSGKPWLEIKTDEPRKLYNKISYKAVACKLHWGFQVTDSSLIVRSKIKTRYKPQKRTVKTDCTCNDYRECIPCRNRERRAAFHEDRIPAYRLQSMTTAAQAAERQ